MLRLLEREPSHVLDLMVVAQFTRAIAEQVEDHPLVHDRAAALVPVADLPQLLHGLDLHAGLLADLADRRLQRALIAVGMALGQAEDLPTLDAPAARRDDDHLVAAHDHAASGEVFRARLNRRTAPEPPGRAPSVSPCPG